jgi:hypothetical protein
MNAYNVTVTIVKNTNQAYSFCVATQDSANLFPTSYDPIREFVTMEENEFEREIQIKLNRTRCIDGPEEFKVVI